MVVGGVTFDSLELLILLLFFFGVCIFVNIGVKMFQVGWSGYEEKVTSGAEKQLEAMYLTMPAQHVFYLSLASAFMSFFITFVVLGSWSFSLVMGLLALSVPSLTLVSLKRRRDRHFGEQLVPALGNMGNALKAGLSLNQAMDLIHREMDNPIAQEFRLVAQELRFGENLVEALQHLEKRMPNPDLSLMVTAIHISTEVGGNLAEVFEHISETIRDRQTLEAKVKALTAQGKMQGFVMCGIPIGLGAILTAMHPDMMAPLYTTGAGMVLMVVIAIMLVMGWVMINKLTRIEF
jgi:tight adherence protein B